MLIMGGPFSPGGGGHLAAYHDPLWRNHISHRLGWQKSREKQPGEKGRLQGPASATINSRPPWREATNRTRRGTGRLRAPVRRRTGMPSAASLLLLDAGASWQTMGVPTLPCHPAWPQALKQAPDKHSKQASAPVVAAIVRYASPLLSSAKSVRVASCRLLPPLTCTPACWSLSLSAPTCGSLHVLQSH
jgi:hypothetical protein